MVELLAAIGFGAKASWAKKGLGFGGFGKGFFYAMCGSFTVGR